MRRSIPLLRGAKGHGWYNKFQTEGQEGFQRYKPPTPFNWNEMLSLYSEKVNQRSKAYFDIKIGEENIGKIVFELADDVLPRTVENFKLLISGQGSNQFSYKGTKLHSIVKNIGIMGGDVELLNGKGNHSAYDTRNIEDENFIIPHTERGMLSMASVGVNTSGSQFYITLASCPHFNGRCMAFGRIVEGIDTLKIIEKVFTYKGTPSVDIIVSDCGMVP